MEQRVLFSADLVPSTLLDTGDNDTTDTDQSATLLTHLRNTETHLALTESNFAPEPGVELPHQTLEAEVLDAVQNDASLTIENTVELIFVDYRTPDAEALLDDIESNGTQQTNYKIVLLDSNTNGIEAITRAVEQFENVDAIHIISHGSDGNVQLGAQTFNKESLEAHTQDVSQWQHHLTNDADILIYGCDVAATEQGQTFINSLASVTGADVAASDDTTGHESLNGNWQFEYTVGSIEAELALSHSMQASYFATLATVNVDTTLDIVDGDTSSITNLMMNTGNDGMISLREAIIAANQDTAAHTILLKSGTFILDNTSDPDNPGDIEITSNITIVGTGADQTTLSSLIPERHFYVLGDGQLTLQSLTVEGGQDTLGGAVIVFNAEFEANDVVFKNNRASSSGGAIYSAGTTTLNRVSIVNNSAADHGGGIYFSTGLNNLTNVTVSGNTAVGQAGGILVREGTTTIDHSTIADNETAANSGGGMLIRAGGTATISNSIFADNTENTAGTTADIADLSTTGGGVISNGYNIVEASNETLTGTDIQGVDPGLSSLVMDGPNGQSFHTVTSSSIAFDAATGSTASEDIRQFIRSDGNPDIGAYEANASAPVWIDLSTGIEINSDNGNDTYLLANNGGAILGGATELTFELMFSGQPSATSTPLISYAAGNSAGNDFYIHVEGGGNLRIFVDSMSIASNALDYRTLLDGGKHSIAVSWENTNGDWAVYVDGQLTDTGTGLTPGEIMPGGGALVFGNDQDSINAGFDPDQTFSGTFYDTRIWGTVVSAADIENNYQQKFSQSELPANLIANWQFDGLVSNEVVDIVSGNNLSVSTATGAGFIPSTPANDLNINENSSNGSSVGYIVASGGETSTSISDLLASDPALTYDATTNKFYKAIEGDFTWIDANTAAVATTLDGVPGQLVTIRSQHENNFVQALANTLTTPEDVWIGASDQNNERAWYWYADGVQDNSDQFWQGNAGGTPQNGAYTNWFNSLAEPSGQLNTDEDYARLADGNGEWRDTMAAVGTYSYIIEWYASEFSSTPTFALLDDADGRFNIDSATGEVTVADGLRLDHELAQFHTLEVEVTDAAGNTYQETFTVTVNNINEAPVLENLDTTRIVLPDGAPVYLDTDITVFDAELSNSDNFDGSSLTIDLSNSQLKLAINGTPINNFFPDYGNITVDSTVIGVADIPVLEPDDSLIQTIEFNANATNARVNELLQSLTIETTDASLNSATIQLTFNDGNTADAQGTGGSLSTNAIITANILDPIYLGIDAPSAIDTDEDVSFVFSGANAITIEDGLATDSPLTVSLSTSNGNLTLTGDLTGITFTEGNNVSDAIVIEGLKSQINNALINLTYTPDPNYHGPDTLEITSQSSTGLVGHYTFDDDTANDTSPGVTQNGTLQNNATTTTDIDRGKVLSLDGVNDQVEINGLFDEPASATLAAWVNLTAADTNSADVISLGDNLSLQLDTTGALQGAFYDGTIWPRTRHSITLAGEGWHHVAYTFDDQNNTQTLYLDGMAVTSTNHTSSIAYNNGVNTIIGGHGNGQTTYDFNGLIDDARVYTRALTASEIASLVTEQDTVTNDTLITVNPINDAPALSTIEALPAFFTEDGAPIGITGNLSLADIDDTNIESARVLISNNHIDTEDELVFTNQLGITGSYDSASGILSLTGSASIVDYQSALQTVAYNNTSNNPSTLTRTVSFEINDGELDSNILSRNIEIIAENDEPVISATEGSAISYTENDGPIVITGTSSVADIDDTDLEAAIVAFTSGFSAGEDTLNFTDQSGITGSYDTVNGILTLSGSATVAEYQTALRSITYENTSEDPNSLTRAVSFQVSDGDDISNIATRNIDINAVNDTPETNNTTATDNEDVNAVAVNLFGTDVDGTVTHFRIDSLAANGTLYTDAALTNSVQLNDEFTATTESLTLYFQPNNNWNGSTSFSFSARDDDGAYDATPATATIDITPVNDNPALDLNGPSAGQNTTHLFTENSAPITLAPTARVFDFDEIDIASMTLVADGFGSLNSTDTLLAGFSIPAGVPYTDTIFIFGGVNVTFAYDGNETIIFTNQSSGSPIPVDQLQTLIRNIQFESSGDDLVADSIEFQFTLEDFGGLQSTVVTSTVNVVPVNDAPVLSGTEALPLPYTENDGPIILTGTTSVTDVDDTTIESATVSIISGLSSSEDALDFVDQSGISGSYNPAAGVLSLSGSATLAQYQAALQSITYENTSEDPSDLTRTVSFEIFDGTDNSNVVTRDIDFTAVNDAPTLATIEALPAYFIEGGSPVGITGNLSLDDVDDIAIESASVIISNNFSAGEDELIFSNQLGITGSYNATTGILTLTGPATVADYQTALRTVAYDNTSGNPSSLTRTVSFEINDGELDSNILSRDVEIITTNDAPVLAATEISPASYTENDTPVVITSTTSVTDVDDTNIESATVAITGGFTNGEDLLNFTNQSGISGAYDSANGVLSLSGSASIAQYQAALQSITYENTSDDPSDLTRTVSFEVFDGDNNSNTATRNIDFTAVNDAPETSNANATADEDIDSVVIELSGTDVDGTVSHFRVDSLPANGTLYTDVSKTTTVQLSDEIAATAESLSLYFQPDANWNGSTSFQYTARDDQGGYDTSPGTAAITINAVNDAPLFNVLGTSSLTPIDEDDFSSAGDIIADIIASSGLADAITDADTGAFEGIVIRSADTADGRWEYLPDGSTTWNDIGSPSQFSALLLKDTTRIRFVPNPDFHGTAVIRYGAWDQTEHSEGDTISVAGFGNTGGSNSVGNAVDAASITVNPVNDAPTLQTIEALPAYFTEDGSPVGITGNLTLNDVDDINIESANIAISSNFSIGDELLFTNQSGIIGSYDNATGILTLTGSASITDYQTAIRSVAYNNTSDNPSTLTRTVSFEINDGALNSNILSRDIEFSAVNDAPVLTATEISPTSYTENDLPVAITDTTSIDDVDDTTIESATVTISGGFTTGEDLLNFTNQSGISGNYDPATGVLSLSGSASIAQYQAALRSITFENTSEDPSDLTRTVSFAVFDGDDNSNTVTRAINFTAVNDAPALSTIEALPAYFTEGGAAVGITGNLSLGDVDDINIESARVIISNNFAAGEDELIFSDQLGITGSHNATTGTLTLTGPASVADYETALRTVAYNNTSNNPSTLTRTVSFEINEGELDSNILSRDVEFTAVNDAPVLSSTEASPAAYTENDVPLVITNTTSVSDIDDTNIEGATVAVTSGFTIGEDLLSFTDQLGITGGYNSATGVLTLSGSATLAQYQAALQSITYENTSEDPSDLTRTVSFVVFDGNDSSNKTTRDIDFTAVNDAPTLSTIELLPAYFTEGDTPTGITGNLSLNDVDDINIESATVSISNNFIAGEDVLVFSDQLGISGSFDSTSGALTLIGPASIDDYQAALRTVAYNNTSDNPSTLTRTVRFEINDGDLDSNVLSRNIEFTAVNDAPTLAAIEAMPAYFTEGGTPVGITGNLSLDDVDDINIESATVSISGEFAASQDELVFADQLGITGSYDSATGILTLTGPASVADYQAALRTVAYTNTSGDPSALTRTVSFEINDGELDSNILSRDIEFTAVNDAPILSGIEAAPVPYTENDVPVAITGTTSVADVDDTNIDSATVSISSGFTNGEDVLGFTAQSGITGSYDSATGVLSLSGSATLAQYQTALQSITYENTSEDPSDLSRTVTFDVFDGDDNSNTVTRDIDFTAVNDAPTLTTIEMLPAHYIENGSPVGITGNLSLNDVDDVNIESGTVSISNNFIAGEDELVFSDQLGITGSYDSVSGTLTLTGPASVADYQTALRTVAYNNTSDNPSTLARTISFVINDGELDSNSLSRSIEPIAENDPPVLSATEVLPAYYTENSGPIVITGTTSVADLDDTNIENAVVAITGGFTAGEDLLNFANQSGITGIYDPATGVLTLNGSATLAQYQTALQSITYENTSEDPSDLSRIVSFEVFDGDDNSNTVTRDIDFTAVNDAPTLTTIEMLPAHYIENGSPVGITGNLSLNDVDDINIESASVAISNNFAAGEDELIFTDKLGITGSYDSATGTLTLTGSASVANYQTALRTVAYNNTSDNPSTLTRTVSFEISDGDLDSNTLSRDIEFTAVNDAPVLSAIEATPTVYTENDAPVFITGTTSVADVDDNNIESATVSIAGNFSNGEDILNFIDQSGISGTYDSATGVLSLSGSATLAQYQTALQSITYENTSEDPSDLTRTVSFEVFDGDDNSNTVTRAIDFTAVNDAPTLATIETQPAYYIENSAPVGITGNLSLDDVDDINIESASISISNNFAAGEDELNFTDQMGITGSYDDTTGILSLSGTASVADYQAALRSATYNNTSDNPSTLTRTISIEINDGDLSSNILSRDIEFTAVNDAPILTTIESLPAIFTENASAIGITGNLQLSDIDDTNIESATVVISENFATNEDELVFTDQSGITGAYDTVTGILTLSGTASVTDYQTALRTVAYQNNSDNPSTLTRTVSFEISDGNLNSNILSRDIEVVAVNDAPNLANTEILPAAYTENEAPVPLTNTTSVADLDDTFIEGASVSISGNYVTGEDILEFTDQSGIAGVYDPVNGVLTLNGTATSADYQTALQSISYVNTSENPSDLTRTVSFEVFDGEDSSNTVTRSIEFTAINDAPVLSTIESQPAIFTENSPSLGVTGNLQLSDVDDTIIESANVSISGNFTAGEDELVFNDQTGITGSFDATTGVLTLSGSATVADYEAALRTVAYTNTSDDPSTLTRTISFEISDGDQYSNLLSRDIDFIAVNDAPVLSDIEVAPATYTENDVQLPVTESTLVIDVDDTTIESATIAITGNFAAGEDLLNFTDQSGISGSYNAIAGTLTLTGAAPLADYQAAIQSVTFQNSSDNPSDLTRTVSIQVNDGDENSNTVTRDIIFNATNDAPVLASIEVLPALFTENAPALIITGNLQLADNDDINIESAAVVISGNFSAGEDELIFSDQSGISGSFDAATGSLNLNGSASVADYQTALQSIAYNNLSDDPSDLTRAVSFTINDGDSNSNTLTRNIEFTAVNDAPVTSNIEATATVFTENDLPLSITDDLTLSDADDTLLESATVSIGSNFLASEDQLIFNDQSGISGSYDGITGVLTLSGNATVADYQNALRSVSYQNNSEDPTSAPRTIVFTVSDGEAISNIASRNIEFDASNDTPEIDSIESNPVSYTENQSPVTITEALIVSDVDSATLESARIAISANYSAEQDRLVFSPTTNIEGLFDIDSGVLTLSGTAPVAEYQQAIRSITYFNTSDNPSTLSRLVELTVRDSELQSVAVSRELIVQSVNDAPTGADALISFLEDSDYTLTSNDFAFSDDLDQSNFAGVLIQKRPALGSLTLKGNDVIDGQFIDVSDIVAGDLIFSPQENAAGSAYDSFEYQLVDDGGTANSGSNISANTYINTFSLIQVNDEPSGTDNTISTPEDSTYTFTQDDFGFSDSVDNNQLQAITVTTLPVRGMLILDGTPATAGAVIDVALIDAGRFQFTPAPDGVGSGYGAFSFQVHDNGGTNNGGQAVDQTPNIINFDVPGINDSPLLITETTSVNEGSENILTTEALTAIDSDDNQPDELTFTINSLPSNGTLILNGSPAATGSTFTLEQLQQNQLIYSHDGSETSSDFFDIQVSDGGEDGATPAIGRFSFIINEVIDPAPVIEDESFALSYAGEFDSDQGSQLLSGETVLAANSLSENPFLVVEIESQPSSGEVTIDPDGSFIYAHDGSGVSYDSFQYRVTNEDGIFSIATVAINIDPKIASAFDTTIVTTELIEPQIIEPSAVEVEKYTDSGETEKQDESQEAEENVETEDSQTTDQPEETSESESSQINIDLSQEPAAFVVGASNILAIGNTLATRGIESFNFDPRETDFSTQSLEALSVRLHNQVEFTQLSEDFTTDFNTSSFNIVTEIDSRRAYNIVTSKQFVDGLKQIDRDFEESEKENEARYRLATDSTIGVSLSATAGILAWVLRGGALFASAMAYTPIWTSIDPVRVVNTDRDNNKPNDADTEVEEYFS